ncbi:MAG: hypothetical protein JKY50_13285 [Oleispira sp.]|nr:hypothetical protein [Oleispira sp.]MBL4880383.1 hypothetical protein [Oleispira sp.]
MITIESRNDGNKKIIIFVHGFTGGKETWEHPEGGYFWDMLATEASITDSFDIGYYEYYTTFSEIFTKAKIAFSSLKSLFKKSVKSTKKNLEINDISSLLQSEIKYRLSGYDEVIVIAHSMGGLITKGCILKDIEEGEISKIKLFISLAVPHRGVNLAAYGKLLSGNKQIAGLDALSNVITSQNDQWVKSNPKPTVKYFYGANDSVVSKSSAVAVEVEKNEITPFDEDHPSICKPSSKNALIYIAVKSNLEDYAQGILDESNSFEIQRLSSEDQFNDENFVLKLFVADVCNANISNSKEFFLNAEFIRKVFSSDYDQEKLTDLYEKIRSLYQDSYARLDSNEFTSADQLINDIHDKIVREDSAYLKTLLPKIHATHKKGMLHQLANDADGDIHWLPGKKPTYHAK